MEIKWLYEKNTDNSARFILGKIGDNPLLCFGINPSTAEPDKLDRTVNYVSSIASSNGYDKLGITRKLDQRWTSTPSFICEKRRALYSL